MTRGLVVHPSTLAALQSFAAQPAHAMLLVGPPGAGKGTVAERLAAQLLDETPETLARYPYIHRLAPDEKGTISIESIRELQKFLQLRTLGQRPIRRIAIIEQASGLTVEAQNAYLKLLEEPPADTVMILTASTPRDVLPTILSRLQLIQLHKPTEQAVRGHFTAARDAATVNQAFFLSGGLPGLMAALLNDEAHPLLTSVATAKEILQKPAFERLCMIDALTKQKGEAVAVMSALGRIAQAMLEQASQKGDAGRLKQWHRILKVSETARQALLQNANQKLVLSSAMLAL